MSTISLDEDWFDNPLLCPVCSCGYLHHQGVTLYNRAEDATNVRVTTASGDEVSSSIKLNEVSGNPSPRRSGIDIRFFCETCHGSEESSGYYYLQILQHKGTTYLDWHLPKD
jgi:hypothetical protein